MSKLLQFIIVALVAATSLPLWCRACDEMTKRGVARYNSQTGIWEWEPASRPH